MQEVLSISDRGTFILVDFFGEFNVEAGKQCVDRMTEACQEYGRSRVLLDCRKMTGEMPIFSRFQVAEYGASKRYTIAQMALVVRPEIVLPDNFVENVAVNRGMNMKLFTDIDKAEAWLSE
jgi:hypothetical protein